MINNDLKMQKLVYIMIFLFVGYYSLSSYIWDVISVTWDDQSIRSSTYQICLNSAYTQARISFFFDAFFMVVPYLVDNQIYYKIVQIGTNIALIVSIGVLLSVLFRNKYLGYLYTILTFALWQNSDGHNLMVSYPFYMAFGGFAFSLASIFLILYLRTRQNKYMVFSLIMWILASKGTEFYMMYVPFFLFLVYFESKSTTFKDRFLEAFKETKWHMLITILFLIAYIIFRSNVEGVYGGSVLRFDLHKIFSSWFTYTFGLTPGIQFYFNFKDFSRLDILKMIDLSMLLISAAVFFLLISFKEKIQNIDLSKKNYLFILLVTLYLIFAPNFLISLTTKYQDWTSIQGVTDYLYSSFSFFMIIVFAALVLMKIKSNIFYKLIAASIAILVILTQINNKYIGAKQAHYSEKYFLLDALLKSPYINAKSDGFTILAPTLWDEMMVTDAYWIQDGWSQYAKKKTGKDIKILRYGADEHANIKYIRGEKNKASFLTYSESGILKAILTFSEKCNQYEPCFLMSTASSVNGSIMYNAFLSTDSIYRIDELSHESIKSHSINIYDTKAPLKESQIVSLLDYNPAIGLEPVAEFQKGFYRLESDGNSKWIWAKEDGKINIKSVQDKKVTLKILLRAASKRKITFQLNSTVKEVTFLDTTPLEISFQTDLKKGDNILEIISDEPSVNLSEADSRKFSYCIFDIGIDAYE